MDILRLKSVGTGGAFWEGYAAAPTLGYYAHYLHSRITAYRELKHDIVRVQAESNRASSYRTKQEGASGSPVPFPPRSAEAAHALVLLRASAQGPPALGRERSTPRNQADPEDHRCPRPRRGPSPFRFLPRDLADACVRSQFYKDDLEDENTVIAFRMAVKDLLVLFQAGNEAILNMLGESSSVGARTLAPADEIRPV